MTGEIYLLLKDAKRELLELRRRNEILAAKVEMIDLFACVLHTQAAQRTEGFTLDLVAKIDRVLMDEKP